MEKFIYFNDTERPVTIHPATEKYGVICKANKISPLEERTFYLPNESYPHVKMWDHGSEHGLCILVTPLYQDEEENIREKE
ncbi:hypothetical protein [Virgibacillus sp. L01]|uniref:hypothetical protein n=1 Tax=Virgibacillus sp. L01 TaxID=3457429 RepID=UPI003FD01B8C